MQSRNRFQWPENFVHPCKYPEKGDYSTDIVFKIAKYLGVRPLEVVERIVNAYCAYYS